MELKFRELKANEIECKIAQINAKGLSLLLYKTARTDMQLLDETVGSFNWKCEYQEIKGNLYCGISIFDADKKEWVTKWDCGVESAFGDKEKAEASDSFKRSGFKWRNRKRTVYEPIHLYQCRQVQYSSQERQKCLLR